MEIGDLATDPSISVRRIIEIVEVNLLEYLITSHDHCFKHVSRKGIDNYLDFLQEMRPYISSHWPAIRRRILRAFQTHAPQMLPTLDTAMRDAELAWEASLTPLVPVPYPKQTATEHFDDGSAIEHPYYMHGDGHNQARERFNELVPIWRKSFEALKRLADYIPDPDASDPISARSPPEEKSRCKPAECSEDQKSKPIAGRPPNKDRNREILKLREKLSIGQVARKMGTTIEAVKGVSRRNKSKKKPKPKP